MESQAGTETFDSTDLPVIFQCQSCNTILSDSLGFVAANDDTKTITVNRVTASVETSGKLVTSTDGIDQGSTYSPLMCHGCEAIVGRVYRTTPRILDNLRDVFTFDVSKLSIYQVGSAEVSIPGDAAGGMGSGITLKELKETTLKMQVLICTMHQRIANIEQSLEIEEGDPQENPLVDLRASNPALKTTPGLRSQGDGPPSSQLVRRAGPKGTNGPGSSNDVRDGNLPDLPERDIQEYPQTKQRGKRAGQLTADRIDTLHSSDAESTSGSDISSSRGSRRKNSNRSSRGGGASQLGRGVEVLPSGSKSRKRTMAQENDDDASSDFSRGLEKVSPIKKKANSRSRKS